MIVLNIEGYTSSVRLKFSVGEEFCHCCRVQKLLPEHVDCINYLLIYIYRSMRLIYYK